MTKKTDAVVESELGDWKQRASEAVFYARASARSKGYALAVHGTLRRDVDIVAIPWTDEACSADELADHIARELVKLGQSYEGAYQHMKSSREEKPFGRLAFAIPLKGIPAPYLDLSVAPRLAAVAASGSPPAPRAPTKERLELIVAEVMEKADSRFQFDRVDRKMLEGLVCVAVETTVERLRLASSGSTGAPENPIASPVSLTLFSPYQTCSWCGHSQNEHKVIGGGAWTVCSAIGCKCDGFKTALEAGAGSTGGAPTREPLSDTDALSPADGLRKIAARMYFVSRLAAHKNYVEPEKQDAMFRDAPPDAAAEFQLGGDIVLDGVLGLLDKLVCEWDAPVTAENHAEKLARIDALMQTNDAVESLELRLLAHAVAHYEHIAFPLGAASRVPSESPAETAQEGAK